MSDTIFLWFFQSLIGTPLILFISYHVIANGIWVSDIIEYILISSVWLLLISVGWETAQSIDYGYPIDIPGMVLKSILLITIIIVIGLILKFISKNNDHCIVDLRSEKTKQEEAKEEEEQRKKDQ